jgi:branched-subunit amino acid ABC-type transport system permease component
VILTYLIDALMLGCIYGLTGVAFTLVYSVLGMVNFAFSAIFMIGSYLTVLFWHGGLNVLGHQVDLPDLGFVPAVTVGILVGGVAGVGVDRLAYRPLRRAPVLTLLTASLAAQFFLQGLGQLLFGANQSPFPNPVSGSLPIGQVRVANIDLVIFAVSAATMVGLHLFIGRTSLGRGIRATAQDQATARLMGIDTERVIMVTFLVGSMLAALAGILYSTKYQFVSASMGQIPALKGIVAAVVGGVGNVRGTFVGGLALGLVETFAVAYMPNGSAYQDVIAFLVLGIVLWVRPQGLLGLRVTERA